MDFPWCRPGEFQPCSGGTAADIAKNIPPADWQRLSDGEGTKGPRLYDWCYLELTTLDAEEFNEAKNGSWTRGLLICCHIGDGDCESAWNKAPVLGVIGVQ